MPVHSKRAGLSETSPFSNKAFLTSVSCQFVSDNCFFVTVSNSESTYYCILDIFPILAYC